MKYKEEMKDYDRHIRELKDFIADRVIITQDDNDYVLISDIHYFINENRDYKDTVNYWAINKTLKHYDVYKKAFQGSMNVVGFKWRPTIITN
jgi:hypothetical protein